MAMADYKLCDRCGNKAFYDANVHDPHYVAMYEPDENVEPCAVAALCSECAKTHHLEIEENCR